MKAIIQFKGTAEIELNTPLNPDESVEYVLKGIESDPSTLLQFADKLEITLELK